MIANEPLLWNTMRLMAATSSLLLSIKAVYKEVSGWSGGAMMLGKLPVPGRPTNLDFSRARAYCACSR